MLRLCTRRKTGFGVNHIPAGLPAMIPLQLPLLLTPMPTKTYNRRENAVVEPPIAPSEDEMKNVLGRIFPMLTETLDAVRLLHPQASCEWKYSPKSGWYQVCVLNARRLFYVLPKRGGIRITMILGGKAIESLRSGAFAVRVTSLLRSAKRYPEGIAFTFTQDRFDTSLFLAFVEAKIAS